jgi:hypothetical protein
VALPWCRIHRRRRRTRQNRGTRTLLSFQWSILRYVLRKRRNSNPLSRAKGGPRGRPRSGNSASAIAPDAKRYKEVCWNTTPVPYTYPATPRTYGLATKGLTGSPARTPWRTRGGSPTWWCFVMEMKCLLSFAPTPTSAHLVACSRPAWDRESLSQRIFRWTESRRFRILRFLCRGDWHGSRRDAVHTNSIVIEANSMLESRSNNDG